MITRRRLQAVVIVAALVASASAALAAPIEIKVRTMLREKPTSSSRILDRLPAGKKVPMLGQTEDGNWVHVRAGAHEGWIQAAAVKGLRAKDDEAPSDESADDEPARPLAKPRGVRPEAWVSKSRYHEGEETKLIVSVNEANLYGRPSNTGAVLGVLRRGEAVQLVKKSADKKWINIDIGGGETAWIEARTVKPGHVATSTPAPEESSEEAAAPPPTITPEGARRKSKFAKAEEPPPPEETKQEEPPPPPPPPKKKGKQAKVETPPPAEEEAPPKRRRDTEDETPPGLAGKQRQRGAAAREKPSKKKRRLKKMAARSEESSSSESAEATVVQDQWTSHGKVYLSPAVRAGIAILSQRFTSNGQAGPGRCRTTSPRPTRSARRSGSASTAPSASTCSSAATPATPSPAPRRCATCCRRTAAPSRWRCSRTPSTAACRRACTSARSAASPCGCASAGR